MSDNERQQLANQLVLTDHPGEESVNLVTESVPVVQPAPPAIAKTVLQLTGWDLHRGQYLLPEYPEFLENRCLGATHTQIEFALSDFFGCAFRNELVLNRHCDDVNRQDFIRGLLEQPEFQALRESTRGNGLTSEIVVPILAAQFAAWVYQHRDPPPPPPGPEGPDEQESAGGEESEPQDSEEPAPQTPEPEPTPEEQEEPSGPDGQEDSQPGSGDGSPADSGEDSPDPSMLPYLDKALDAIQEEVELSQNMEGALGIGPGGPAHKKDPREVMRIWERIRNDQTLQEIIKRSGALVRLAMAKQRTRPCPGTDDLVGITLGGNPGHLIGSELLMLAHPLFQMETLQRLLDKQCLVRKYRSREKVGKGPICVIWDESGSMNVVRNGVRKVVMAKALALAMGYVAARQKRWLCMMAYADQGCRGALEGMSSSSHRVLVCKPGQWDTMSMLTHLEEFLNGGYRCDVPIGPLPGFFPKIGAPRGRTDVIFITDAICNPSDEELDDFAKWKNQEKAVVHALIIDSQSGKIDRVCDAVYQVPCIDPSVPAVGDLLTI